MKEPFYYTEGAEIEMFTMEMGINTGVGRCLGCDTFLHITFNPERQEMDLERFEDYQNSKKARDDVDKIAGNVGYGGQGDENL